MAVAHTIEGANGNNSRRAVSLLDMDGDLTHPSGTEVSLTVITEESDGTDVDASAAVTLTTAAELTSKQLVEAFVDKLNDTLTGARASFSHQGGDFWTVTLKAIAGVAWTVDISTPTFDNTPV